MPIKSRPNSFIAPSIKERSNSFSNFTQWIKGVILRKQKSKLKSKSKQDISINERSIIRRSNSTRRTPSKKSFTSTKRRRSRRVSRRPGSISRGSSSGSGSNSISNNSVSIKSNSNDSNSNNSNQNPPISNSNSNSISHSNFDSDSDSDSDSDLCEKNKNANFIIIKDDESKNNDCNNNNNNNNMIIPNVNSDTCELSTSDDQQQQPRSSFSSSSTTSSFDDDSRNDYFENTRIIKGSDEHFAYVRTLRKLRRDRQRPMNQAVLLNNILETISIPSLLSDKIRKELYNFKTRVYELNRLKRNSIFNINDTNSRSLFNNSALSLCPSSLMNKRLSAIIAEAQPKTSRITTKYRPSYASSKVVTIFDDETNQLVVKDLPLARRKRRLSDLSNILVRSTSSSSTTSTNSSQSSLVTLTDDIEQYSPLTKEPASYISNHIIIRKDDDDDDYEEGCYEDDVPLFVLKEQFRYSGRGYGLMKNNLPSLEVNGPPCVTLTV